MTDLNPSYDQSEFITQLQNKVKHLEEVRNEMASRNVKLQDSWFTIVEYLRDAYKDESSPVKTFIRNLCENFDIVLDAEYTVTLDVQIKAVVTAPMEYEFSASDFDFDVELSRYASNTSLSIENVDVNINDVDWQETN